MTNPKTSNTLERLRRTNTPDDDLDDAGDEDFAEAFEELAADAANIVELTPRVSAPARPHPRPTKADIEARIAELQKGDDAGMRRICELMHRADLTPGERDAIFNTLVRRSNIGKKLIVAAYSEQRPTGEAPRLTKAAKTAKEQLDASWKEQTGQPFVFPGRGDPKGFYIERDGDTFWVCRQTKDGAGERLMTPAVLVGAGLNEDRGGARTMRLLALLAGGVVAPVEFAAAKLARSSDVHAELFNAGVAMSQAGLDFVPRWLGEAQPRPVRVKHRPGWLDCDDGPHFMSVTGEIIPPAPGVELARAVRAKEPHAGGTSEGANAARHAIFSDPDCDLHQMSVAWSGVSALCSLAGIDPPLYALAGGSSRGKSTLLANGASAWAHPGLGRALFRGGQTTATAFHLLLDQANGVGLCRDEISHMRAEEVRELAYLVQQGADKHRASRDIELKRSDRHCTSLFTSAERTLAQQMQIGGVSVDGGIAARAASFLMDGRPELSAEAFQPNLDLQANFGWTGPEFIEALFAQGYVEQPGLVVQEVDAFAGRAADRAGERLGRQRGSSGYAKLKRAGAIIGLLHCSASILQRAAMIPADFDVEAWAMRLWDDVMQGEMAPTDEASKAVARLIDHVMASRGGDVVDYNGREEARRPVLGYYGARAPDPKAQNKTIEVYVLRTAPLAELVQTVTPQALREALEKLGYLVRNPAHPDSRTWSGFPGLGKAVSYVVLRSDMIES